VIATRKMI